MPTLSATPVASKSTSTYVQNKKWSRGQTSLLSKSLLVAGSAFLLICLIGIGFGSIIKTLDIDQADTLFLTLNITSFVLIIVSMILSMVWVKKIQTASTGFAVVVFLVYIIAQGCGFGMIFGLYDVTQLSLTFGIGGAIFLVTGLIGTMLSDKAMMSLKKMLTIGGMVYLGLMVILMVSLMIRLFVTGLWGFIGDWYYYLILMLAGLLMVGYIAYDINMIQKQETFIGAQDDKVQRNMIFLFGFKLLVDLVGLIWIVASFVLRFTK